MIKDFRAKGLKLKQSLSIMEIKKSTFYYKKAPEDATLMRKIKAIAHERHFYGYRKIWAELRKKIKVNHKKVYRLYRMMNLQKPVPLPRPKSSSSAVELTKPEYPNHIWVMDFTFTRLTNVRKVKVLTIEDMYSRKGLWVVCGFSLRSCDVIFALKKAIELYGKPVMTRSDNGPEFIANILKGFLYRERIQHEFIPKGSPYLNGMVERFIGSLKGECLLPGVFDSLNEVEDAIMNYQRFYNQERPHQAIDYQVPDDVFYPAVGGGNEKVQKSLIPYGNQETREGT